MRSATLARHPAFGLYAQSLTAAEKSVHFWNDMFRTSSDFTWWWTKRWMEAPKVFMSFAAVSPRLARQAAQAGAAVIDLAEAMAERTAAAASAAAEGAAALAEQAVEAQAAMVEHAAATQVAVTEQVAELQIAVAERAAETVEAVTEELKPDPDDLTLLVGIGPKLAAALSECGVSRFSQIAAWSEDDLVKLDKALDLKGRAVRDAWVAQAKRLAGA